MPAKRAARGLAAAVVSPDRRVVLEGLRDAIVVDIEATEPRYRAPLYTRLESVLAELGRLPLKEASAVDDLASRRAARLSKPPVVDGAAAGVDRGRGGGRARS